MLIFYLLLFLSIHFALRRSKEVDTKQRQQQRRKEVWEDIVESFIKW